MRLKHALAGALAAVCLLPAAALAQAPVGTPGSVTPGQAICFGAIGTTPTCVDATHPLPVTGGGGSGGGGDASAANQATANGYLSSIATQTARPLGSASVDGSGSISTANTAQQLFSGTTPANGFKVAIPVTAANASSFACYVSDTTTTPSATTAGSYPVFAGGQWSTDPGERPAGPVYLSCPQITPFSAKRW